VPCSSNITVVVARPHPQWGEIRSRVFAFTASSSLVPFIGTVNVEGRIAAHAPQTDTARQRSLSSASLFRRTTCVGETLQAWQMALEWKWARESPASTTLLAARRLGRS
jgi:hypothetical protein